MLNYSDIHIQQIPDGFQPTMVIIVDTEEEYDWFADFSRDFTSTDSIDEQWRAQDIFNQYGVKPTYVVDYCMASQGHPRAILKSFYDEGICDIGVHLHPWINPPFDEDINDYNSYHGNLPIDLERAKISALVEKVTDLRGSSPTVFKAGRYGVGVNTADLLTEFGFQVDCSVVPHTDMGEDGGPDFRGLPDRPYWFQNNKILEVPLTKTYFGKLRKGNDFLKKFIEFDIVKALKIRATLGHCNIINQVSLTPEGIPDRELKAMLIQQVGDGRKIFNMAYHSSSLSIDGSPYVKSEAERKILLTRIEMVLDVFINQLGGRVITMQELHDELKLLS